MTNPPTSNVPLMTARAGQSLSAGLNRRNFLIGAAAFGSLAALTACSSPLGSTAGASAAARSGFVMASVPTLANEYFTMWKIGGSEAAKALGLEFRMQSYDGSAATQIDQLRSAGASGAGQVMTFPINNDAVRQMGKILAGQKIPMTTSFAATPWMVPSEPGFNSLYSTLFSPREVLGQKAMAEAVFTAIGGSGNVVYVKGAPTNRTSNAREKGFDLAVAEYPGITVLAKQEGKENGQDTRPVVQTMLSNFNNLDAIVCHNSSSALGAVSVLEEKGNTHIKVGGTDEQLAILDKMIAGPNVVAVQSIFGTWLGGYMIVRNYDLLHGVKYDPIEEMIFQDSLVLDTKESAAEYKRIAAGSKTGFDWRGMSRSLNPTSWDSQVQLAPIDPTPFFVDDLDSPRPAGFEYPAGLKASLDAGGVAKFNTLYAAHAKTNPYDSAITLTTTGTTVFGSL